MATTAKVPSISPLPLLSYMLEWLIFNVDAQQHGMKYTMFHTFNISFNV